MTWLLLQCRMLHGKPLLQLAKEQWHCQLLALGPVSENGIDRPVHALDRSCRHLVVQHFMLSDQRKAKLFSDHPLHMLGIEGGIAEARLDALFLQHVQQTSMCPRMVAWIAENAEPSVQGLGWQFV